MDATLECDNAAGLAAALALSPTATDNCTATPTLNLVSDVTTADALCANAYVRVRTWNFDDGCGNVSANYVQTITVEDNTAPVIVTAAAALDATLECDNAAGLAAALALSPTATDNCTATPTLNLVSDVTTADALCANAYVRVRTWNFDDGCGNVSANYVQTITVEDNTAPVIVTAAAALDATLECDNAAGLAAALALSPTATDNCTAAPTLNLVSDVTTADALCANAYVRVRTWNFDDGCGNVSANYVQTITVEDNTAPVIVTAAAALDATLECDNAAGLAAALALSPTATDNCTAAPTLNLVSDVTTELCANAYVRVRTWNFDDGCGNVSANYVQTITVEDNTAPIVITIDAVVTLDPTTGEAIITPASIDNGTTDNCTPNDQIDLSISKAIFTCEDIGDNTIYLIAEDDCGNIDSAQAIVTVTYLIPPDPDVDALETIICNNSAVNITLDNSFQYMNFRTIATPSSPLISGFTPDAVYGYPDALPFTIPDVLTNTSDTVQWVTYTITPLVFGTCPWPDETITIYVNPSPSVQVTVTEDTICDLGTTVIDVASLTSLTSGVVKYNYTIESVSGDILGQTEGFGEDLGSFTQTLDNRTDNVQWVQYRIHPYTEGGSVGTDCDGGDIGDTLIIIYVNPTPRIEVVVANDTICDMGTSTITVSSPTSLTSGDVVFDYTVESTSGPLSQIDGYSEADSVSLGDFYQTLNNHTETVQWVEYRIHPHTLGGGSGTNCDYGDIEDTTFIIYVNPTPRIEASTLDSVICNDGDVLIEISHPNGVVAGEWKYNLRVDYGSFVTGINPGNDYNESQNTIVDQLYNSDTDVHVVYYIFTPSIGLGSGGDCENGVVDTVFIYVNPTPEIDPVAPPLVCTDDIVIIDVETPNDSIMGDWEYILKVDYGTSDSVTGLFPLESYGPMSLSEIRDSLTNNDTIYHDVIYRFYPRIIPSDGMPYCENGVMDSVIVTVDPKPAIRVEANDTILCNNEITYIEIDNPHVERFGEWVYNLETTTDAPGILTGFSPSVDSTDEKLYNDTLVNNDTRAHFVKYVFTPIYKYDEGELCSTGKGEKDSIIIWVNPTPEIIVNESDLEICSGETITFEVINPNTPVEGDDWIYELSIVQNPDNGMLMPTPTLMGHEWGGDTTFSYTFTNTDLVAHQVTFTFTPRIESNTDGDFCPGPNLQKRTITIHPTPGILPTIPDTLICDNRYANIVVRNPNTDLIGGEWWYFLNVDEPSGWIEGERGDSTIVPDNPLDDTSFEDRLDNTDNGVHEVIYRFMPYIQPADGGPSCVGVEDKITVWVNPTPSIDATIPDYVLCNYTTADFEIIDNLDSVMGYKMYETMARYSEDFMDVFDRPNEDTAWNRITDWISDSLVNNNRAFQTLFYQFTPAIYDSRPGKEWESLCTVSSPDTTIRIYVNPTPIINIDLFDPILCDGELTQFTVSHDRIVKEPETSLVYYLDVDYNSGPVFPGGISAPGDRPPSDNIQDLLINNSDTVQLLKYSFTARIRDNRPGHEGNDCYYNGTKDTIPIRLNPTPRLSLDFVEGRDTLCFGEGFEISTISEVYATHPLIYNLAVINDNGVSNVSDPALGKNAGVALDQAEIQNDSMNVGIVQYEILPIISSEGCEGDTWTQEISLNPNPLMDATKSDWAVCYNEGFELPMSTPIGSTTGQMQYQLRTDNFTFANISGPVPAPGPYYYNTVDTLDQPVQNTGEFIEDITYFFRPVILNAREDRGDGGHCWGLPEDSILVEVAPELKTDPWWPQTWYRGKAIQCHDSLSLPIYPGRSGGYYRGDFEFVWDITENWWNI